MAAAFSSFSKPLNRRETIMSAGGTMPIREAGGNMGSAAKAAWTDRTKLKAAAAKAFMDAPPKMLAGSLQVISCW
jgi:hypothetical protein